MRYAKRSLASTRCSRSSPSYTHDGMISNRGGRPHQETGNERPATASMDRARMLHRAALAQVVVEQLLRRRVTAAVLAGLELREPRLTRALDHCGERVDQGRFRQPPPFQPADAPRARAEHVRALPPARELGHAH